MMQMPFFASPTGKVFLMLPLRLQAACVWLMAALAICLDRGACRSDLGRSIGEALACSRLRAVGIALSSTAAGLRYGVDMGRLLHGPAATVQRINERLNRFEGLGRLNSALIEGKGVLLTASFFSCFYYALMCPWPAAEVQLSRRRVHLVVPRCDALMLSLFAAVQRYSGREIHLIEMGSPAAAILAARALRAGDIVVCMIDNVPDGTAVTVSDFFGHPACHPAGFLLLATRFGAPIVNCGTYWSSGRFTTWFDRPLLPEHAPAEGEIGWLSDQLTQQLEARVRARPGQWTSWPSVAQKWNLARSLGDATPQPFEAPA